MKILLVMLPTIDNIKRILGVSSPPLSLAYLATVARNEGHKVKIIDSIAENISFSGLEKRIRNYNPDIVGITATTMMIPEVYRIAKHIYAAE